MKKIFLLIFLFTNMSVQAQVPERKPGESKENFVKRILPAEAIQEPIIIEHKFNSPGKKIVYFYKKLAMDISINQKDSIQCIYAGILIPESETSKTYSQHSFLTDCNRDYNCTIGGAEVQKNRNTAKYELQISFVQINRASTRLLLKTYKTFLLKEVSGSSSFTIEEVKE